MQVQEDWTVNDWKSVPWSDESQFMLGHTDGRLITISKSNRTTLGPIYSGGKVGGKNRQVGHDFTQPRAWQAPPLKPMGLHHNHIPNAWLLFATQYSNKKCRQEEETGTREVAESPPKHLEAAALPSYKRRSTADCS